MSLLVDQYQFVLYSQFLKVQLAHLSCIHVNDAYTEAVSAILASATKVGVLPKNRPILVSTHAIATSTDNGVFKLSGCAILLITSLYESS